jgi:nicotinamide-nucleotide amidase
MDFEGKIISREISELLWESEKTVATAESCTGGRIAESIIAVPGASKYFKGGIICYVNEVKENLLGVSHEVLEEKTAVCEEVAIAMVKGACRALNTDYAVASTGIAGPSGGTKEIPVGTIWLACGTPDNVVTYKVEEDHGRDINLAIATNRAMQMLRDILKEEQKLVAEKSQNSETDNQ